MHWLGIVGVLAVMAVAETYPSQHNPELLEAILRTGEAAAELMDFETHRAFTLVLNKIVSVVKDAKMDNKHLSAAMDLVWLISRRMEEGKVLLGHIQHFIDFSHSGKLSKLLSTWDKELLKKP
ncbi:hypothetical protein GDO81_004568 [Engystomops pustulosus]|uniref:Uncharacterized protein n=1 Tax=Engystomops pustulosus TaxID=76066 RepID=A0AAV6ZYI3_ENGPU|nr:hypothetical protein GDO81_004568 [Engystomops pustulosus]